MCVCGGRFSGSLFAEPAAGLGLHPLVFSSHPNLSGLLPSQVKKVHFWDPSWQRPWVGRRWGSSDPGLGPFGMTQDCDPVPCPLAALGRVGNLRPCL